MVAIESEIVHVYIIICGTLLMAINQLYYEVFAGYALPEPHLPLCFTHVCEYKHCRVAVQSGDSKRLLDLFLLPQIYFKSYVLRYIPRLILLHIRVFVCSVCLVYHW